MEFEKYFNYVGFTVLMGLTFANARYGQIKSDMPKNVTLVDTNNVKIEVVYSPKVLLGLIPLNKQDTSYSATFTRNYEARDGSIHSFEFKEKNKINDLSLYDYNNPHLSGLDKKSDSCYRVLGQSINKEYSVSLKSTIEDLLIK